MNAGLHGMAEAALDALYTTALGSIGKKESATFSADFHSIVGAVITGRIPISDGVLDRLVGLDDRRSCRFIFSHMKCLLLWRPGQLIRTLYASFTDYLTDLRRCGNCPGIIDPSTVHHTLARGCIRLLKTGLRFKRANNIPPPQQNSRIGFTCQGRRPRLSSLCMSVLG